MTHELRYRQMDIPELDAFLEDYRAVCEKHGMQFSCEDYGYDGGHYVTIEPYSGGGFYLNIDESRGVPCIERAAAEAKRLNEIKYAEDRAAKAAEAEEARKRNEMAAIENGIVLGGTKYRLVRD